MKSKILYLLCALCFTQIANSQNLSINADGSAPDGSAMLDVVATDKGLLIPRMTEAQKNAITNPATSLIVYQTDGTTGFYFNAGTPSVPSWIKLATTDANPLEISDADNDTKIQVEESGDEDIIRFDQEGTEFFRMDSGRFEVVNTGNSVMIGEGAGLNDDQTNNRNVYIGASAGNTSTTGQFNVFLGNKAGLAITGSDNTILGGRAAGFATGGSAAQNTVIGRDAASDLRSGNQNTVLGSFAAQGLTTGSSNILIGNQTANGITSGTGNIIIGNNAAPSNNSSDLLYIENSNSSTPLIYGDFANDSLKVYGTLSVGDEFTLPAADGSNGQVMQTDGSGNVSWGTISTSALIQDADNDTKIQVEESGDEDIIRFDQAGTEFFRMDSGRMEVLNPNFSIAIGQDAGQNIIRNAGATGNIVIGAFSHQNGTGRDNVAIGFNTLISSTSGQENVAIGARTLEDIQGGQGNTGVGTFAVRDFTSGNFNTGLGRLTLQNNTTGSRNVAVGNQAGSSTSGSDNIFLGNEAGTGYTGDNALFIENSSSTTPLVYGDFANDSLKVYGTLSVGDEFTLPSADGSNGQVMQTDGSGNVSWGTISSTSSLIQDADNDTKIQVEESANENTIRFDIGGTEYLRLDSGKIEIVNTGNSVIIGDSAGISDDLTGRNNTFFGFSAGKNVAGDENVFLGFRSGENAFTDFNVGIGGEALRFIGTGDQNVAVGDWAMRLASGSTNVAVGSEALYSKDGDANVAIGQFALNNSSSSTGSRNTAIGTEAGASNSGSDNIFIGYQAGSSQGSISNRLYIDNSATSFPLIYGDFAADSLVINGKLNVGGFYVLPSSAPTASGEVLRFNGTGLEWGNTSISSLVDGDGDTEITLDNSDDDIIRFRQEGTEFFRMDSGRIEVVNTGSNIFIGQNAGLIDPLNNNLNIGIGRSVLSANSTGESNVVIGTDAMKTMEGGYHNVAIGTASLENSTSGGNNTAIGRSAGRNNITGDSSVFIGFQAGRDETGSQKLYIENSPSSSPLIYGDFAADSLAINGKLTLNGNYTFPSTAPTNSNDVIAYNGSELIWTSFAAASSLWNLNGSDINYTAGNVGIGTSIPNQTLDIMIGENDGGAAAVQGITLRDPDDVIASLIDGSSTGESGLLQLYSSGTETVRISASVDSYINSGSNFGIGNSSPSSALDVTGDIETGSANAFYFGDPTTDGSWRIVRDGNDLSFERRETGTWVFKMKLNP